MPNLERILVGVDLHPREETLRPGSLNAVGQALWVAQNLGAELDILHSTHPDDSTEECDSVPEERSSPSARARESLESLLADCRGEGVACELHMTSERPWHAITQRVLDGRAQLVLAGKREQAQESDARRLGSVACNLLRLCPGPIWFVKPEHDLSHKLVLAATDLTEVGKACVEWGAAAAGGCTEGDKAADGELHVAHAYRVSRELQEQAESIDAASWSARLEELRSEAQAKIAAHLDSLRLEKEAVLHIGRNTPYHAIKEAVEHLHPDLLVMGAISRGGRPGYLLGSTAQKLVERVDCSLLVIKPRDFISPLAAAAAGASAT
jgi:universal stress protein E